MVLKATKMPAILVEVRFLTNEKECPKLGQKDHLDRIAKGLAQGIILQVQRQTSRPQASASSRSRAAGTH